MRRVSHADTLDDAALTRAIDRLRALVRSRGLKASSVRDQVARAALRRDGRFLVEDLLRDLRARRVADVHPATVYRVLPLLVEAGLLQPTFACSFDDAELEHAITARDQAGRCGAARW